MRRNYQTFPIDKPDPTIPGQRSDQWPVLQVRLGYGHARSPRFDAVVNSGSSWCIFKSDLARLIGISDVTTGPQYPLGGVIGQISRPMYFHRVKIYVEPEWMIECMAGFCDDLAVTGLLGRRGFFDNFLVKFDHSGMTPALEVERIYRA